MVKKTNELVSIIIVSYNRKKELIECIESCYKSSYKPLEIIVVDNASKPHIVTWLPEKFPKIKLITNHLNVGAAEGRNIGVRNATGKYLLFMDDDATADTEMVASLVEVFERNKDTGIVQPLIYDSLQKNVFQGAGHDIDLATGRIKAWGVREEDKGQYDGLRRIPMAGCIWMVTREVIEKIGEYDPEYFIPYEDSDFSIRASKAGYKIYSYSKAKSWHQARKATYIHPWLDWLGITSSGRAFRVARNKMIFMRKNAPGINQLFFFFILVPIYTVIHSLIIFGSGHLDILGNYLLGVCSGIWYALVFPFRNIINREYKHMDKELYGFKVILMAWTDPLPWVIDRSCKTILDLACGQGKPMQLIKARMHIEKAVGVDLFLPYIEQAKKDKIHDEYVIEDIRYIKFKPKSFDVVLASHVLEHLSTQEAWKVLENMERIAKKQVIIATPIGPHYHPAEDGNILQIHHSHFYPEDFIKRGYKVKKYGWKWLLGDQGMVHKVQNDILRKFLYTFNILLTPVFYLFQDSCDYTFVAYKDVKGKTND